MDNQNALRWPAMVVMAVATLGYATLNSARLFLMEQSLCRSHYALVDPTVIRPDGSVDERSCKLNSIQADLALLSGNFQIVTYILSLIATPAYTGLATSVGKRAVLCINACSWTLGSCYFTAVCYFYDWFDIRMIWLTGLFGLIGGGEPVQRALLYTYIGQSVDEGALSVNLYYLSAFLLVVQFLGTSIGTILLNQNVWLLSVIGTAVSGLTVPLLFLLPRPELKEANKAPSLLSTASASSYGILPQDEVDDQSSDNQGAALNGDEKHPALAQVLHLVATEARLSLALLLQLFQDAIPRLTILIYLSNDIAMSVRVIFQQWAAKRFGWSLAETNGITSLQMLMSGVALLLLPIFSTRILAPLVRERYLVDLWVTRTSLASNIIGILCVAVAPSRVTYLISLSVYTLGSGLADSLRSFATSALGDDEEEIRKLYMGISMTEVVAQLVGTPLWSVIFSASLRAHEANRANLPFFGAAVFLGLALGMTPLLRRHVERIQYKMWAVGTDSVDSSSHVH